MRKIYKEIFLYLHMAYTSTDYTKDLAYIHGVKRFVLPFENDHVRSEKIDIAWNLLGQRYHKFAGRAFRDQVSAAVPDIYKAAQQRVVRFENKQHKKNHHPLFTEPTLEERLAQARAEGRVETRVGDEAEALGYCGCIPVIRIKE